MSEKNGYVSRVVQLDALALDAEFYNLVKNQVGDLFSRFNMGHLYVKYEPEVTVIIKLIIWQFTLNKRGCTIGQSLFGVKYPSDAKDKFKLLFMFEAILPYAYDRLCSLYFRNSSREVPKPVKLMEKGLKLLQVVNFCTFLLQNRYPSLVNRFARVSFVPGNSMAHPYSDYTYQVRELLWHQISDFLMFVLPLINFHRLKRQLNNWSWKTKSQNSKRIEALLSSSESLQDDTRVKICCICDKDAIIPQTIDFCTFCYSCIKANLLADPDFKSMNCVHSPN